MQRQLMEHEVAALIAEARRMGLSADELKRAIDAGWEKTPAAVEVSR
jgi:DNA-binding transcriptional regulator YhcF (GntR family)